MHTVKDTPSSPAVNTDAGQHQSDAPMQAAQTEPVPQGAVQESHTVLDGGDGSATQAVKDGFKGELPAQDNPFSVRFPDDIPVSQELLDNYQAFCLDCGLNNDQAQQAVDFYLKEQTRHLEAERELSVHILKNGAWKNHFDERLSVANNAVRALDAQLGGRLQPLVEAGLGNNHVFAEMMACVGDLLQEEDFIPHTGSGGQARSMSTEDFLRNEVFKTR